MKKLIILTFLLALVAGSFNASAKKVRAKDLVGEWKYEAPSAPYGYEKGTLAFSEEDKQLVGSLNFTDGSKVKLESIKFENDVLTFSAYVAGGYVNVNLKLEEEVLKGVVNTPDGDMQMTATKAAKE